MIIQVSLVRTVNSRDGFTGVQGLIRQAYNQIKAAKGAPIDWYFGNASSMNAVRQLFADQGIVEINFVFKPPVQ